MPERKLLDQVRDVARLRHLSIRTEEAYCQWIKRFVLFHNKRHPRDMNAEEITRFLTHLAVDGRVAASTQNQALNALVFLYRQVLKVELTQIRDVVRARQPRRLPVVLTRDEAEAVLVRLNHLNRLIASLLYGSGLRLMEAVRLRVKDIDFARHEIVVRDGKGEKDRITMRGVNAAPQRKIYARPSRPRVSELLGLIRLRPSPNPSQREGNRARRTRNQDTTLPVVNLLAFRPRGYTLGTRTTFSSLT